MTAQLWSHLAAEEKPLWRRWLAGDETARAALVEFHFGLVGHFARRFEESRPGSPPWREDLLQSGSLGLLQAVDGFDPARGVRFATYAAPFILGEMRRFLRSQGPVRLSAAAAALAGKIAAARDRLAQQKGREPTVAEIAAALQVDVSEIVAAQGAAAPPVSLDAALAPLTTPDHQGSAVSRLFLQQLLKQLPERQQQIVRLRFGHGWTQQQTAAGLQLSQSQISRLEKQALKTLKARAAKLAAPAKADRGLLP